MRELTATLSQLRQAWLIGGKAQAPQDWSALFAGRTPNDLDLVALTGQAFQFGYVQHQSGELKFETALPVLDAPQLNTEQRLLFQRATDRLTKNARDLYDAVWLAGARGYAVHPLDWMPASAQTPVPAIYRPWQLWMERIEARAPGEVITPETWSDWSWTERRAAALELRMQDLSAGRDLIAAVAAKEPADKRADLMRIFWHGLSVEDVPFLESLSTDRSDKVKSIATALLARVRRNADPTDSEIELAGFFSVKSKGVFNKSKSVELNAIKTDAQRKRRLELFDLAQFLPFATALGMSEIELLDAWNFKQAEDVENEFVTLVTRTGSEAAIAALLASQSKQISLGPFAYSNLISFVPEAERVPMYKRMAVETSVDLNQLDKMAMPFCGFLDRVTIEKTSDWKKALAENKDATGQDASADFGLIIIALSLGILVTSEAASWVISQLSNPAYPVTHPIFDVLHFNASLKGIPAP